MNCFFILGNNSGVGPDGPCGRAWLFVGWPNASEGGLGFVRGEGRAEGSAGWALIVAQDGRKTEPAGCLIAETGGRPGWEAAWWAASGYLIRKNKAL